HDVHRDGRADRAARAQGARDREVLQAHRRRRVRAQDAGRGDRAVRADRALDVEVRDVHTDRRGNARVRPAARGREAPDDDVVAVAGHGDGFGGDARAGHGRVVADLALRLDVYVVEADRGA